MGAGMRTSPLAAVAIGGGVTWITIVGPTRVALGVAVLLVCGAGLALTRHPRLRRRQHPPASEAPTT